ncbi:TPA: hypothetical protein DEP21_01105 [Patescibacteria group bacterium]|nr:hypothetical protein [Candidatus Gracilibacteria bacterium]
MSKSPKMTHEQNDNKEYCSEAFLGILDRVSKKLHLLPENIQAIERQLIENIKQNHSIKTTHNDVYENLPE